MAVQTEQLCFETRAELDIVDITDELARLVADCGMRAGTATVFCPGATGGLTTVEYEPGLVAGVGTYSLEIFEDLPDVDAIIVPIGGGSGACGACVVAGGLAPHVQVIGVQAALCSAMVATLRGETAPAAGQTIADGIAVKDPGKLTRAIIAEHVADILLVSEGTIERAITLIAEIEKVVAEGAGAVALAAVLGNPARFAGKRVGLVISGANIDSRILASVLIRGLVRSGLLVRIRVEVSD